MLLSQEFEIPIGNNDVVIGNINCPKKLNKPFPIVIIVRGFTGHKDWGFLPYLALKVSQVGFVTITFNFSTDVVDPDRDWFVNVDKFSSFTISQEVEELNLLVKNIKEKLIFKDYIKDLVDVDKIYLIGQSLGGAISIIYTAKYDNIEKVCLLGSVGTLFRYSSRQVDEWKKIGHFPFTNTRTGQELKINFNYYQDLVRNDFKLEKYLSKINVPVLFIHGSEDLTVPIKEIQNLIHLSKNPFVELIILPNTNHTFGIEHPFKNTTESLEKVIEKTIEFFKDEKD